MNKTELILNFNKNILLYSFSFLSLYHQEIFAHTQPAAASQPVNQPKSPENSLTNSSEYSLEGFFSGTSFPEETKNFYIKMNYKPAWHAGGIPLPSYQIAMDTLAEAYKEGLNPQDYHIDLTPNWAENDIRLTTALLKYSNDVRGGRIPPKDVVSCLKISTLPFFAAGLLFDVLKKNEKHCNLDSIAPQHISDYVALKKILAQYRELEKSSKEWPTIPSKTAIKPGMDNAAIPAIRQILIVFGDLAPNTLTAEEKASKKYDPLMTEAVKRFQARNTLVADGIISTKTLNALNQSPTQLIKKITLNMEKLRWLPQHLGERYLLVNVAGYELTAIKEGKIDLRLPIIVGKPSTRTPLLYAPLKSIIINPSWGVPPGIMSRDKLPKIRNDPDYVRRAGFTITDSHGHVISPDDADWDSAGESYHLHQGPGRHNALGRIKFNILNPYTIYLHGTPDEKLFSQAARAFSSGCIRLKDPKKLAEWVLAAPDKWTLESLQTSIDTGKTQTVPLNKELPVYFTYLTAWVDEQGVTHFSPDVYKIDASLEKKLEAHRKK